MAEKKKYTPPQLKVIEIKQFASILTSSPFGGGNMPPTTNNNDDNDWYILNEVYENKI